MKRKVLAGLVVAGVLGVSGAAFANVDDFPKVAATTKSRRQPLEFKQGERPPMPPDGAHSRDKRPPEFDGKKPPLSGDRRMPPPPGAHSRDKRPPKQKKN